MAQDLSFGPDVPSPISHEPFPTHDMTVFTQIEDYAIRTARQVIAEPSVDHVGRQRLDYFVDGSLQMRDDKTEIPTGVARPGGYAVVTSKYNSYGCSGKAFQVEEAYSVVQLEKMAITEALAAAVREVEKRVPSSSLHTLEQQQQFARVGMGEFDRAVVRVFVSSENCLEQITPGIQAESITKFERDVTRPIDIRMVELSKRLAARGCTVELHWTPRSSTDEQALAEDLSRGAWVGRCYGHDIKVSKKSSETKGLDEEVRKAVELFSAKKAALLILLGV
ncbi:hypothetical protein QBC37DRAFT_380019 [Rhypophila decipiens]|uniref:Uncharacterized protein n=1 Tax=Rhypophila decipiens TaxID=261697 RepID=A0AAN7AZT7_9PEZI|nr:hypothetical protein QBC37DRAFT_380019 [Rhypophila decipiens]